MLRPSLFFCQCKRNSPSRKLQSCLFLSLLYRSSFPIADWLNFLCRSSQQQKGLGRSEENRALDVRCDWRTPPAPWLGGGGWDGTMHTLASVEANAMARYERRNVLAVPVPGTRLLVCLSSRIELPRTRGLVSADLKILGRSAFRKCIAMVCAHDQIIVAA